MVVLQVLTKLQSYGIEVFLEGHCKSGFFYLYPRLEPKVFLSAVLKGLLCLLRSRHNRGR